MPITSETDAAALLEPLDALGIAAAYVDEDGRISSVNPYFFDLTGVESGAVIDRGLKDFLEAASIEHNSYGDGSVYRFNHPRGDRWLRPKGPRGQDGGIVTLIDVTAEWGMLGKLVSAIDVRDRLMRDADVGMFRYDPDTRMFQFSEALMKRSDGAPHGPIRLDEIVHTLHPDDIDKDAGIRERITTQGGAATCSLRRRKPDGGWRHTLVHFVSGRRLTSGRYEVFGISQNITELVDARDQAAVMQDRLEIAMSAASAGVYEIDLRSSERWTSPQYQALAGADALTRHAMRPFGMYHDDDIAAVRESWERCLRSQEVESIDARLHRPNGGEQWVRIFMRVQRNEHGVPTRAVGLMLDIQQQKQQELALIEAKQQAEAATIAKSSFLASMSHEIRTPLNGVLGMAQSLAADDLSGPQQEKVNVILDSGKTLTALLNDVLDLSKIEAGKIEIATVDGELAVTFDRLRQLFLQRAVERGLNIDLQIAPGMPEKLHYDPVRVRQCVGNLLSNAIKFTERGVVKVAVSAEEVENRGWKINVAVSDTGIGMNQATLAKLFTTFTQADATITRRFGGSGLGLAITRQLARLMGGDVTVASESGRGSTFTLTFMAEAVDEAAAPVIHQPHLPTVTEDQLRGMRGIKILLVDDNAVNRQVVKLFVAQLSPAFVEATNGQEALDRLHDEAFDLVLLDVHMPVMDGKEAIKRIRASGEKWRDLPVIALTADAMSGDRERYLALGMSDYVSKPLDQRELTAKLAAAMQGRPLLNGGAVVAAPLKQVS
ncbi:MAG: ATP-binding protein [Hyphomonadaceae bacterium]|nr:ATP-binding protein [Hyphomonadaceae bacterium]